MERRRYLERKAHLDEPVGLMRGGQYPTSCMKAGGRALGEAPRFIEDVSGRERCMAAQGYLCASGCEPTQIVAVPVRS
jgi:hypothetical protein